ncbi:MAG: hypothetical protein WC915_06195 [archaeon]|jgi:hypothetical protein
MVKIIKKVDAKKNIILKTKKQQTKENTKQKVVEAKETIKPEVILQEAVNETKKENNSKKQIENAKAFAIIGIVIILVLAVFYMLFFYSPYKYQFNVEGVTYKSNNYTPTDLDGIIKNSKEIYLSPRIDEANDIIIAVKNITAWSQVLSNKHILPIQLIRVFENGSLKECYTNDGNVFVSNLITKDECNLRINNANNYVILFEFGKSEAIINANNLVISSNRNDMYEYAFRVLENVFANARDIILLNNEIMAGIN